MARPFYGYDLAYIHDAGFGDFARKSAPKYLSLLKRRSGRIVELGCGSGAATRIFTRAGFSVVAVDASPEMIRLARKNAPKARYIRARLPDISVPPCDAVIAVGEVLNYMSKPSSFDVLFKKVFRAVKPGGFFIFDVKFPSGKSVPIIRGRSAKNWSVQAVSREDARGRLVRRIASFRRVGKTWRRSDETHRLTLLKADVLLRKLRSAGFAARAVSGVFVACKRA